MQPFAHRLWWFAIVCTPARLPLAAWATSPNTRLACPDDSDCRPPVWTVQMITRANISIAQAADIDAFLDEGKHDPDIHVWGAAIHPYLEKIQAISAHLRNQCAAEQDARVRMEDDVSSLMRYTRQKLAERPEDEGKLMTHFMEVATMIYARFRKHAPHNSILGTLIESNTLLDEAQTTADFYLDSNVEINMAMRCFWWRVKLSCTNKEIVEGRQDVATANMDDFEQLKEEAGMRFTFDRTNVERQMEVLDDAGRELRALRRTVEVHANDEAAKTGWLRAKWAAFKRWAGWPLVAVPKRLYWIDEREYMTAEQIVAKVGRIVRSGADIGQKDIEPYSNFRQIRDKA